VSVITYHLAPSPRDEGSQGADADAFLQEMDGTIREHGVGPARVEAVDLTVVGTVDRARPPSTGPIRVRAMKIKAVVIPRPGCAVVNKVATSPAGLPERWPAGILGDQDGVGCAISNLGKTRHLMGRQDASIVAGAFDQLVDHQDRTISRVDPPRGAIVTAGCFALGVSCVEWPGGIKTILLRRRGALKDL